MLNSGANRNCCGECKAHNPTWASWNLGIFLCGRCASAHRSLGDDISQVKSLSMDHWSHKELSLLEKWGNKRNNDFWNEKRVPFPFDPEDKDSLVQWLRDKYKGKYKFGSVRPSDYNLAGRDSTDDYGFDRGSKSSRSYGSGSIYDGQGSGMTRSMRKAHERLNGTDRLYHSDRRKNDDYDYDDDDDDSYRRPSRPSSSRNNSQWSQRSSQEEAGSGRLTFRRPTSSEEKKYGDYARKMKFDMGYSDFNSNIEALVMARGDINKAAAIVKRSGPAPTSASSSVPSLPRRRENAGALLDGSKAGGFDWLGEDGSSSNAGNLIDLEEKQQQIFQYMDPNTGAVYYIDANGQQYADPNSGMMQQQMDPIQQQMAMQQMQQQLMLQQQQQQQALQQQQTSMQMMPTGYLQQQPPTLEQLQQQQQMQQMQQMQHMQQMQMQQQQPQYGAYQAPGGFQGF